MMKYKPIGPTAHGAIDYGFVILQALAPGLFNLKGSAKTLCYTFAGMQGLLNAFTDHPLSIKKVVPLRIHGELEMPLVPALLVLPLVTGAMKQHNGGRYFISFFGMALANFLLTDYLANEKKQRARRNL